MDINTQRPAWDIFSPDEMRRQMAQKVCAYNFRMLKKNISGAWFSFGDEAKIEKALTTLLATPHGQGIVANIDPKITVESSNFTPDSMTGSFSSTGELLLNTNKMTHKNPVITLAHELLHAKQAYLGNLATQGLSPAQVAMRHTLVEAECEGWDRLHQTMLSLFGTIAPGKKKVDNFYNNKIKVILLNQALQNQPTKEGDIYRFAQALQRHYPDLYQAQKSFVAGEIRTCLSVFPNDKEQNRNTKWKALYNAQALGITLTAMRNGHLTKKGNTSVLFHHINRLVQEYNLDPKELMQLNLTQAEMQAYKNILAIGEQQGYQLAKRNAQKNWRGSCRLIDDQSVKDSIEEIKLLRSSAIKNR